MLGYMNEAALAQTLATKWVTFYSRSKNTLWVKGDSTGNKLALVDIMTDCDQDALLIKAAPQGPTCHTGITSCFGANVPTRWSIMDQLEAIIAKRFNERPDDSYTAELFNAGINRIAQKVGEESVEAVIAAVTNRDDEFIAEAADLIFHLLVLLQAKDISIDKVIQVLESRIK
jgi:phosphoribosyl-ATP pyrophosphohydrolase/phosphoribosyl-AMP cyclohydrolase